jgi:hypothetical protein
MPHESDSLYTIDKRFRRQEARNTYNRGAKIGEVHASNRTFPNGSRENKFLNVNDATIVDEIHKGMSLDQVASYVLNASQEEFKSQDDMMLKAATIASSLESCWSQIVRCTPQRLENFLAQVKKQAPSHRPDQQAFIELLASCSKSDNGFTTDGLSSDAALVICDDDSSNCDDVMSMLVGDEAAKDYYEEVHQAEDLGGYGADGGRGNNSAEGRQHEAMMAHMRMISNFNRGQNDRYSEALSEEGKKRSRLDREHLQGLAVETRKAPTFNRGFLAYTP